jgi:hypothetical protein
MQLSLIGGPLGILAGLIGVWLLLSTFDTQHRDYLVPEARHICEKAKFDAEFSATMGKPDTAKQATADAVCGEYQGQADKRKLEEPKAEEERKAVQESIKNMLEADKGAKP